MVDGLEGGRDCESPITAPEVSTSLVWVLPFKVASATTAGGTEGGFAALAQSGFPSLVPFVVAESLKAQRRRAK